MMRNLLLLAFVCLLTGCSSLNYMNIDTYNPAEVTFPDEVKTVLVVNNAYPQSPDTGYEYSLFGVNQDSCQAVADSALFDAPRFLAKAIAEADFFDDVLIYHYATREDTIPSQDAKLTAGQVIDLCEETGTDAVISFDRLLFNMKKEVTQDRAGGIQGKIRVDVYAIVRGYLPGRENSLATVLVVDSVFWEERVDDMEVLDFIFPTSENALRIAAAYVGNHIYPNFVPHWTTEPRWYFTSMDSRWKEASSFANGQKWESAAKRWESLYDTSSKKQAKARLASNIALCHEMTGQFKEAFEWAERSRDYFKETLGESHEQTRLLTLYAQTLFKRIQSDVKLDAQLGR